MFEYLRIKNFRSIEDSGLINLSKLNLLVGANNSGKSSILSILLLLKQTLQDSDPNNVLVTSGPLVDLGSYLDMVREPSRPLEIEFRLTRGPVEKFVPDMAGSEKSVSKKTVFDTWKLSFLYNSKANEVYVEAFELEDSASGTKSGGVRRGKKWELQGMPEDFAAHLTADFQHFVPRIGPGGPKPEESLAARVADFGWSWQLTVMWLPWFFERLSYVGPIRERIPRYGVLGTMSYSELTPSGQNLMRVLSARGRTRYRKLPIKQLNEWLDKRFQMLRNVRVANVDSRGMIRTLIAEDRTGETTINLAATGAGISQIVPVVVQTLLTQRFGCLIVEQPEIHLHPGAQTTLADLFLENLSEGRQYIIETHSEHLVLRLRRRVAEGKASPANVKLMFVEKTKGRTEIRTLDLDSAGQFAEWPAGFFDEGYQEALALTEAGQKE